MTSATDLTTLQPFMRVLVAEDDTTVRSLVRFAVQRLGHECLEAPDGLEAWSQFQAVGADVVVSDWVMPRMDGPELCRRIREGEGQGHPYTYFIMLTALDDQEHALAGMRAGADEYLRKPFDVSELRRTLVGAERVSRLHRQIEATAARRDAVLRAARRLAGEGTLDQIVTQLLSEALTVTGGHGSTIYRWDDAVQGLRPLRSTVSVMDPTVVVRLGEGAAGRSIEQRSPAMVNPGAGSFEGTPLAGVGVVAAVAAPMFHEGRTLGAIEAVSYSPDTLFSDEDAAGLELLTSVASATMIGRERAWLEGIQSAAQLAERELRAQIAEANRHLQLLTDDPHLPPGLRSAADAAITRAETASAILEHLRQIAGVEPARNGEAASSDLPRWRPTPERAGLRDEASSGATGAPLPTPLPAAAFSGPPPAPRSLPRQASAPMNPPAPAVRPEPPESVTREAEVPPRLLAQPLVPEPPVDVPIPQPAVPPAAPPPEPPAPVAPVPTPDPPMTTTTITTTTTSSTPAAPPPPPVAPALAATMPLPSTTSDVIAGSIDLAVGPITRFTQLAGFTRALRSLPGVADVATRQFYRQTALLRIRYDDPMPLQTRLQDLGGDFNPQVTAASPTRIELRITPPDLAPME